MASLDELFKGKPTTAAFILIFIICCCLLVAIPDSIQNHKVKVFAEQLYNHEIPDDARVLQTAHDSEKTDDGRVTYATVLLQTSLTEEELTAFYNDTSYTPARDGDTVTLTVYALDDSSLKAIQQAGLYQEDGGDYWFVYLYSSPTK